MNIRAGDKLAIEVTAPDGALASGLYVVE